MTQLRVSNFMLCTCMAVIVTVVFFNGLGVTEISHGVQRQNEKNDAAEFTNRPRYRVVHGLSVNVSGTVLYSVPKRINNTLTAEERTRVEQCQKTAHKDRRQGMGMFLKDRHVCVRHHTYLKRNDTVVIEVGGNVGKDAFRMVETYKHRHIILEPVPSYASRLREKFKNHTRVTVLNFGLGEKSETKQLKVKGIATSIFGKEQGNSSVYVMNSTEFFLRIGVGVLSVDLLTMDCEGCEFYVIESLVFTNMVMYFKNIQFESHAYVKIYQNEDWIIRYCMIQEYLSRTHRLTYQYKHVWENWRRLDL